MQTLHITCDNCYKTVIEDDADGWSTYGREDLCPGCQGADHENRSE